MKLGIVGSGSIVSTFLKACAKMDDLTICAICVREHSFRKAAAFSVDYAIDKIYFDYDKMLADNQVDTIYVALPNSMHFAACEAALQSGKHVICEKPFTSNLKELKTLAALAKKQHLLLFEAVTIPYLDNYKSIKSKLHLLGNMRIVSLDFYNYAPQYSALLNGENPQTFDIAYAGGTLMDTNLYNIHFAIGLFGMPDRIQYYANMVKDIDTSGTVIMTYKGFVCMCSAARDSKGKSSVIIAGDKGRITVNSASSMCKDYTIELFDGNSAEINTEIRSHVMWPEFSFFTEAIANMDYVGCERMLEHSLTVMEVCDMARKSAGIVFDADN